MQMLFTNVAFFHIDIMITHCDNIFLVLHLDNVHLLYSLSLILLLFIILHVFIF